MVFGKMKKKEVLWLLQILWMSGCLFFPHGQAAAALDRLSAEAIYVVEAKSGRVIYEKNSQMRLFPASTTKMMTAIVALEQGQLEDIVTIGPDAAGTEGSSMLLQSGEQVKLEDLLYGILMVSGNDATIAVADHLAGSVENYAERMTRKAHEIGAKDTNFVNSSGLPNSNHYSTAADLGKIAVYAYKNSMFKKIVKTKQRDVQLLSGQHRVLENTNLLLENYQGCNGLKTGYTQAAGECLVASAERHGVHLIAVLMNVAKDQRWQEAETLLDYGFQEVKAQFVYDRNDLVKTVYVVQGDAYKITVRPKMDIFLPILNNDGKKFSVQEEVPVLVEAPVRSGQQVGWLKILYQGKEVDRLELIADQDVPRGFSVISWLLVGYRAVCNFFQL